MKKALRFVSLASIAALMLLVLTACGGNDAPVDPVDPDDVDVVEPDDGQEANNSDKIYVIYSDTSFPPFEYYDADVGDYVGLDMDLVAAIAADQGFEYEMRNEGFDPAMAAVQAGQADAMIAGMTINDLRRETFDFSDGYYVEGQIMVVATGSEIATMEDLRGLTVACKMGTMGTEYAEANEAEYGYVITYYEDSPTMYQAVMNGNQAACFEDLAVVDSAIKTENLALEMVGDVIEPAEYGFAVKKGENAELITMFNAGLANIKANGIYDAILEKYNV